MAPIATKDLETHRIVQKTSSDSKDTQQPLTRISQELLQQHDHVLKSIRMLVADLCQQFNGGHPGGAIGMAAIGVALWKYVMNYAPHTPDFFNRDRFVLSNGHTCLFQYVFLHLSGYRDMTMDQLKSYHSDRTDALCPGHPEIEHEGIEVTTGPLGQGVANAVGMAMASKHLAAEFNQPGFDVVSNHTWCMIGDACLQEGVALEAISLAGHLQLNNLTIIYDNNQITCDGSVDLTNTEDINAKMRATGWEVIDVEDGLFDIQGLVNAFQKAKRSTKPTFINVRTIIGYGSAVAGTAVAHGAAFGAEDVAKMKKDNGFDPESFLIFSDEVRSFFAEIPSRGQNVVRQYEQLVDSYERQHPELAQRFRARRAGEISEDWQSLIPKTFPEKATASRASSGLVFNPIAQKVKNFMVGTADLSPSVNMIWKGKEDFQRPGHKTACGINGSYAGRYIHYGVREHAMAAIANGLAAFNPGTIIPVTSSFFMFYLYAAPAVRMGALQHLQVIHAATHDSIGMGEDGPTHQPLELAALYRAMPNLLYIRPGDSEETAGAWIAAINAKTCPSIISTSRHAIPQFAGLTSRDKVAKGAYVLREAPEPDDLTSTETQRKFLTVIGVGAELSLALSAATTIAEQHPDIAVRVVSFPCQRLFDRQPLAYRRSVLPRHLPNHASVVIEPYVANGWERYADASVCMSTNRFGQSLPGKKAYEFFGYSPEKVVSRIDGWLGQWESGEWVRGEFAEL